MINTEKMIEVLFPKTNNEDIQYLVELIDKYGKAFGVASNIRIAHFLSQAREELGSEFKPTSESMNYSSEALLKTFSSITKQEANTFGRDVKHSANQEEIANIVYANRLGNGPRESGDGWNFRGQGSLQITGAYNYEQVQNRIDKYAPNSGVNIVYGEDASTLEGTLLIGLGFWIWKDLYRLADKGTRNTDVDRITKVINKWTDSYQHRQEHFKLIKHLI